MRKDRNILCIFAEYMSMKFILQHKDPSSHARAGELHTDHGVIRTPIFMPVGTAAHGEGHFPPRRARRSPRADHPGKHLPPLPAPRHGDPRTRRRRAPLLDLGRPDAHRQRRLSGLFAGRVPQAARRRDAISGRTSTARSTSSRPKASSTPSARSAPTS